MQITISGVPGSGKSTLARCLAERLKYKHYSVGQKMREIAKEKNISLLELNDLAKKDPSIDKGVDDWQKSLAKEDKFVLDSRLGFHFIPQSIKIFLDCDEQMAAGRIYERHDKEDEDVMQVLEETRERLNKEVKRYEEKYGVNFIDKFNFDFIVDTTNLGPNEVCDMIEEFVKRFL